MSLDVFLWVFLVYFIVEVSVYCARCSTVYSLYTTAWRRWTNTDL